MGRFKGFVSNLADALGDVLHTISPGKVSKSLAPKHRTHRIRRLTAVGSAHVRASVSVSRYAQARKICWGLDRTLAE
jgi:hypothetical protein